MTTSPQSSSHSVRPGHRYPVGACVTGEDVNFCVFSRHATRLTLLLYDDPQSPAPFQEIELDPEINRSFFFWHVRVLGLAKRLPVAYTWRADGPHDPEHGHRFDPAIELLDPWARAITDDLWQRPFHRGPGSIQQGPSIRGLVTGKEEYDWEGDTPLTRPCHEEIIYELHVRGFTRHPSAGVTHPGTFAGLIEKIPYLVDLGINVVELMPIMAFDRYDLPDSARRQGLVNYWGYATHSFFSPHPGYCVRPLIGSPRQELRDLVKALHRAGISIVLDVAFNHTAEGGADGPVINFKGLLNRIFYHLDDQDPGQYKNFSGCGNTINCNHPLVARFILECLEYWVREFHIDGFRFDLASILARGEDGRPMHHAPVVWNIELSDGLAHTRLIAEAWDAGGLYQVGGFPGLRWAEWNGRYRDLVRQFVRGDGGLIAELATRLTGSSDLYQGSGRRPMSSINFITCHDGFTLHDLVSYNHKHNQANGENNRDGDNHNHSWNCGREGPTNDPAILALRRRQAKNFMAILLLSLGVPMLLAGDEVLRSQKGNNNCYCQDNELSWFDWNLVGENADMLRFTREMIRLRKRHPALQRAQFLTGRTLAVSGLPDIRWHGLDLDMPLWDDPQARLLACTISRVEPDEADLHLILNMDEMAFHLPLPEIPGRAWSVAVDTGARSPADILPPDQQIPVPGTPLRVTPRTVMVLEAWPEGNQSRSPA
jgi:glycogen operon protein